MTNKNLKQIQDEAKQDQGRSVPLGLGAAFVALASYLFLGVGWWLIPSALVMVVCLVSAALSEMQILLTRKLKSNE